MIKIKKGKKKKVNVSLIMWHGQFDGGSNSNWSEISHKDEVRGDSYSEPFGFYVWWIYTL